MISKRGRDLISVLTVLYMTVAIFTLLTASRMLYVWHNQYLAAIKYHSLLLLVNLQGQIQDFLREGASQADMIDVQSQKSAEKLPNMNASATE